MEITAAQVKELREKTGAGMMECKKALGETNGDIQKAIDYLREQGILKSAKLGSRATSQGAIFSYVHPGDQLGVLVEINCETDFVARTDDFKALGKNIAMQVAASAPQYVSRDQVPQEVLDHEKEVSRAQAKAEGKPEKILDKIVEGRLEKYFQEVCLLDQAYIRDDSRKVSDLVTEAIAKIRENITIKRFVRFKVGE
ncbi:MAG TPA: translation elongation factor Ts [Candidatus Latescibacteria bacterium]|nr:MAG: Elongation factor Ts [Candidatus Latescibacteria bacterium ADurb.Bin168]HOF60785.1 translation elongation factor Ts [Candidatus Latescibacterota bacterium]HOS64826.1 translation elongation factor Ts [Candidatus Latescibacterota bacterium]HPK73506.1 translation elongation factor Ts [Candidatus Latescibacterota bacterium]HPU85975.1 translation elongation factor Ts [Candidatus Latescibacterota bacterium]